MDDQRINEEDGSTLGAGVTTNANRRHKNLQKYRRHLKAQRHNHAAVPDTSQVSKEGTKCSQNIIAEEVRGSGKDGKIIEKRNKPETTKSSSTKPLSADSKSQTQSLVDQGTPASTLSPRSGSKRRADILKRMKNRSIVHPESPKRENHHDQEVHVPDESHSNAVGPVLTDQTTNKVEKRTTSNQRMVEIKRRSRAVGNRRSKVASQGETAHEASSENNSPSFSSAFDESQALDVCDAKEQSVQRQANVKSESKSIIARSAANKKSIRERKKNRKVAGKMDDAAVGNNDSISKLDRTTSDASSESSTAKDSKKNMKQQQLSIDSDDYDLIQSAQDDDCTEIIDKNDRIVNDTRIEGNLQVFDDVAMDTSPDTSREEGSKKDQGEKIIETVEEVRHAESESSRELSDNSSTTISAKGIEGDPEVFGNSSSSDRLTNLSREQIDEAQEAPGVKVSGEVLPATSTLDESDCPMPLQVGEVESKVIPAEVAIVGSNSDKTAQDVQEYSTSLDCGGLETALTQDNPEKVSPSKFGEGSKVDSAGQESYSSRVSDAEAMLATTVDSFSKNGAETHDHSLKQAGKHNDEECGVKLKKYPSFQDDAVQDEANLLQQDIGKVKGRDEKAMQDEALSQNCNSFDLRSIHEHPPAAVRSAESELPPRDASWDTAKVLFSEFHDQATTKSNENTFDMFDATDATWDTSEGFAFDTAFEPSPTRFLEEGLVAVSAENENTATYRVQLDTSVEIFEEKKELEILERHPSSRGTEALLHQAPPQECAIRPETLASNDPASFQFSGSDRPTNNSGGEEESQSCCNGDDEDLLPTKNGDEDDGSLMQNGSTSKQERLEQYSSMLDDHDSISASSRKTDVSDESSVFSDTPDVGYMTHVDKQGEDAEMVEFVSDTIGKDIPIDFVDDAPAFRIPERGLSLPFFEDNINEKNEVKAPVQTNETKACDQIADHIANCSPDDQQASGKGRKVTEVTDPEFSTPKQAEVALPEVDNRVHGNVSTSLSSCPSADPESHLSEVQTTKLSGLDHHQVEDRFSKQACSLSLSPSSGNGEICSIQKDAERETISQQNSKRALDEHMLPANDTRSDTIRHPSVHEASSTARSGHVDLEESTSLVGVSLVPSFGGKSSRASATQQIGEAMPRHGTAAGIPPLGNAVLPPPPPPPPQLKKKKRKKSKDTKKGKIPLIAPPPEEKLKKWKETNTFPSIKEENSANYHALEGQATSEEAAGNCGKLECHPFSENSWEDQSHGGLKLACGAAGFSDAIKGFATSPPKVSREHKASTIKSPVDAARSIALENAMRRATGGVSMPSFKKEVGSVEATILSYSKETDESNMARSVSIASSETAPGNVDVSVLPELTRNMPPVEVAQKLTGEPDAFLQKLTSPSLSMSPANGHKASCHSLSPGSSPIISDKKMAEKAALASYTAALAFEEQYACALEKEDKKNLDQNFACKLSTYKDVASSSFFCTPELSENLHSIPSSDDAANQFPSLFFSADGHRRLEDELAGVLGNNSELLKDIINGSSSNAKDSLDKIQQLKGGAFSPWKNGVLAKQSDCSKSENASHSLTSASSASSKDTLDRLVRPSPSDSSPVTPRGIVVVYEWLAGVVLDLENPHVTPGADDRAVRKAIKHILEIDENFNKLCSYVAEKVNNKIELDNQERAQRNAELSPRKKLKPFLLGHVSGLKSSSVVAANFVSFLHRVSRASDISSPFGEDNPFLLDLVGTSMSGDMTTPTGKNRDFAMVQKTIFRFCAAHRIVKFAARVCGVFVDDDDDDTSSTISAAVADQSSSETSSFDMIEATRAANPSPTKAIRSAFFGEEIQDLGQSPFEDALQEEPKIIMFILGFLGDPAAVCRVKALNRGCFKFVAENEHILMRDAARLGGISMNLRPSFWLWVTLEKFDEEVTASMATNNSSSNFRSDGSFDNLRKSDQQLVEREEAGRASKWHHVIQRDVARAFGNMPPHKTGARLRNDSIVRALVTWGRNRIMKRGVKGDGDPPPSALQASDDCTESDSSQTPTDTVSDWGGVSPVASFNGSCNGMADADEKTSNRNDDDNRSRASRKSRDSQTVATELLVLSGNALTDEMKTDLQNKLSFVLHSLAATYDDVGYCQGMDYVVAHLLRILQDTIRWRAAHGTLPCSIKSAPKRIQLQDLDAESVSQSVEQIDKTLVVEETVFRVMDSLFTTYNLQHMYWPELRCLKTCCKVFERLIQLKLPVLADHFDHHDLNVGLFALGWFQTLFLYLPSMPSATVCHMWDIWLVERSFKIFFRVGTAILFLSQPTLLNHELEGMMTYLNTFPDATLLNPDILIACALQIKVTNKMLVEIESEVTSS